MTGILLDNESEKDNNEESSREEPGTDDSSTAYATDNNCSDEIESKEQDSFLIDVELAVLKEIIETIHNTVNKTKQMKIIKIAIQKMISTTKKVKANHDSKS